MNTTKMPKLYHDPISDRPIDSIIPAPENDLLYGPISADDLDILSLADSIREFGIKEPLVVSLDDFIISGHRRQVAAKLAGLAVVPVRVEAVTRGDPAFMELLREHNRQRVKSFAEIAREEAMAVNPTEAHRIIVAHRRDKALIDVADEIEIVGKKHRAKITKAKTPFLEAILAILRERRDFWPLTVRQIHYVLLNRPPLIHASKPDSVYANNQTSYKAAIDLCARARIVGQMPWEAIDDETRPISTWCVYPSVAPFIRNELDGFMKRYYRDLQQSQPNHIEIVGEKNTIAGIIHPVAEKFCIPMTIGRGYSSLPPRHKMYKRFKRSGKENLILLVVSDHDPEGADIPHSFARSMRDDFGIEKIVAKKVALTQDQVDRLNVLPNNLEKKKKGTRYKRFVEQYGKNGYELEAVEPTELQRMLRESIDCVLDKNYFNAEIDAEKRDSRQLHGLRQAVKSQLASLNFGAN